MRTRLIHLINPKADCFTSKPLILKKALYSPLAGLLQIAALFPRDKYEIILTDENIEPIGISSDDLWMKHKGMYEQFYSLKSMAKRFPYFGRRARGQWSIMNTFFRKGEVSGIDVEEPIIVDDTSLRCQPQIPHASTHPAWQGIIHEGTNTN